MLSEEQLNFVLREYEKNLKVYNYPHNNIKECVRIMRVKIYMNNKDYMLDIYPTSGQLNGVVVNNQTYFYFSQCLCMLYEYNIEGVLKFVDRYIVPYIFVGSLNEAVRKLLINLMRLGALEIQTYQVLYTHDKFGLPLKIHL